MFDVDTGAVRHLAAEFGERAAEIRDVATALARRVDDVPWRGAAADAMRAHTDGRLAGLLHSADLHDDAGEALIQHAAAVDHALALIAATAETVVDTVEAAIDTAGSAADSAADSVAGTVGDVAGTVADHAIGLLR